MLVDRKLEKYTSADMYVYLNCHTADSVSAGTQTPKRKKKQKTGLYLKGFDTTSQQAAEQKAVY